MFNNFMDYQYQPYHRIFTHQHSNHGIYLGDVSAALDMHFIKNQPINVVVTAAKGMDHVAYPENLVKHIVYPLLDAKQQNISQFFQDFYELVQKEIHSGNILVHCAAGISRSATLVIAYIMKKNNMTFKQAIKIVRDVRPIVLPNLGFERQLKELQIRLNKKIERQPKTSQVDRKVLINSTELHKNSLTPSKIEFLPEIGNMGKTALFHKPKPLEKNIEFKMNIFNMKDFQQRKLEIKTRKSEYETNGLKKKGSHFRNVSKQIIFAKVENGRRKLIERPNNFVNANALNDLRRSRMIEDGGGRMIEEGGSSLNKKKLSSLSYRSEKLRMDRKIVKNHSSHKYEKSPDLFEQMGRVVVSKLHLNERRFVTEKQNRGRITPKIAVHW